MTKAIIIGIHGLLNKPPQTVLEDWWAAAIAEGLQRNHSLSLQPPFALAYWADIRNAAPIPVTALEERYEPAAGWGPLPRYDFKGIDKVRIVAQKWGGLMFDKEKQLIGLGTNVERLLGIKFDDLEDYYDDPATRQQMRARLSELLARHQDKRIMLLAHSMGSIIAYDVLRTVDGSESIEVEQFVTLGSPLGLPIVAHKIRQEFGQKRTPTNVERWTNLADPGDKVAIDCNLADEYAPHHGVGVSDVLVHNGYVNHAGHTNNHKSYGYLRAPEMSDQIQTFLRAGSV